MADRVYRQEEIHRLLERAMELHGAAAPIARDDGLTLGELEEVARETGIDPAFVRQAALELEGSDPGTRSRSSTHVFVERVVPGELTDARWAEIVTELERRFGSADGAEAGSESRRGDTRSWHGPASEHGAVQLFASPAADAVSLRLSQKVASADSVIESSVWGLIAALVLGFVAFGIGDDLLITALVAVLAFTVGFPAAYALDRRWRSSRLRDVEDAADVLVTRLSPSVSAGHDVPTAPRLQEEPSRPLIVIEEPEEAEKHAAPARRARSR